MKSAVSLVLIVCLVGTTYAAVGEDPEGLGPIHRFIAQNAARLTSAQQTEVSDSEWRRVVTLAPGIPLIVTERDGRAHSGYLASTNESGITLVKLSGALIPSAAMPALRDAVSAHPGYFVAAQQGQTFLLSGSVRLARNGVFVMDQKVADLNQLIEAIARTDVQQITSAGRTGGSASWAAAGAAAGIALGLMSTVRIAFSPCGGSCTDEKMLIGLSLVGLPVLGGVMGYKGGGHDVERIFYRAP